MVLPDAVMAFMLLASCNLSDSDSHLVMTGITDVTYEGMRAALLRIFGHKFTTGNLVQSIGSGVEVKVEPTLCAESKSPSEETFYTRGRYAGRRWSGRSRSAAARGNWRGSSAYGAGGERRQNPMGADGRVSRCAICSSMMHWARECPHAYENSRNTSRDREDSQEVNFSAFIGCTDTEDSRKLKGFVKETNGCAVLDCACVNTVCGESWLSSYLENLSDMEKSLIREESSEQTFTFGDGKTYWSNKKITIPCCIDGLRGEITTDVVKCEIPLLLSIEAMKKLRMKVDFEGDYLFFQGNKIKLCRMKSGHYYLPLTQ